VKITSIGYGLGVVFFLLARNHNYQKQDRKEYYSLESHGNVNRG
jgi:hypothetical protein